MKFLLDWTNYARSNLCLRFKIMMIFAMIWMSIYSSVQCNHLAPLFSYQGKNSMFLSQLFACLTFYHPFFFRICFVLIWANDSMISELLLLYQRKYIADFLIIEFEMYTPLYFAIWMVHFSCSFVRSFAGWFGWLVALSVLSYITPSRYWHCCCCSLYLAVCT